MSSCAVATIGPYRVSGVLGQGAMGIVYAGVHEDTGTAAAIKTVFENEASRFGQIRREIRTLARLHHPGVVRILDHGVTEGQPWYAMERLEGTTLKDVFERLWRSQTDGPDAPATMTQPTWDDATDATRLFHPAANDVQADKASPARGRRTNTLATAETLREGLSLLQRVSEALSFLHGEGVVHRDLKPANIFIRQSGEPVLVDFGLAEEVRGATGREQIDAARQVSGSPAYMSPEQIRGKALDARSDLYALGCILYEFLTGNPPFAGGRSQTIRGHLEREPLVPSALVADVPPRLDTLIVSLLTKEQADRPGYADTVAGVLADLGTRPPAWSAPAPAPKPYLYRAPFVGRRDMLTLLDDHLTRARAGTGALVLVSGESGAGKTRLALETGILARRLGLDVATGGSTPLGESGETAYAYGAPLHPFRPLVETMVDRCLEGGPDCRDRLFGDQAAVLADYFPALKTLPGVADLPSPPPLPGAAARQRLFRAFEGSLAAHLERRALFLVLDDLQWADELSLDFLNHLLAGRLPALPLLVFGAFRSEERTETLDALFADARTEGRILGRMRPEEVREMTRGMLAMPAPPDGFVTFLTDRSNGNPFFIAEYLRGAVSERVLVHDRLGRWSLPVDGAAAAASYEALPLPGSLRQIIELRLGKLGPAERRIVDIAALMGRVLDIRVLRHVEALPDRDMLAIADELVSRQIIEPADGEDYRFVHDKIGEITEAALSAETRRGLHHRLADAFEAVYPEGEAREDRRAALGRHRAQAGEPERAAPHLRAAAERAWRFHSISETIALFAAAEREVSLVRSQGVDLERWREEALGLAETLGDVLTLQNRHAEARAAFDRAASDAGGVPVILARLGRKTGKTLEIEHSHDAALETYRKAEDLLGDPDRLSGDARTEWIQITLNRVWIFYWLNRPADITAELEKIRPSVERGGAPTLRYQYYMSLVNRNHRLLRYRAPPETLDFARRMLEAAFESGTPTEIAFAHYTLGFSLMLTEDLAEAEAELFEAAQACQRLGDMAGATRAVAYTVIVHRRQRDPGKTAKLAEELIRIAKERGMDDYLPLAQANLGWVAWRNGDRATADRLCRQALETWKGLSFPYPIQWLAGLVLLAMALDHGPDDEAVDLARMLGAPPQMHLPDPLYDALGRAGAAGDAAAARPDLLAAIDHARALGYL